MRFTLILGRAEILEKEQPLILPHILRDTAKCASFKNGQEFFLRIVVHITKTGSRPLFFHSPKTAGPASIRIGSDTIRYLTAEPHDERREISDVLKHAAEYGDFRV
jgi:hypothetical protein